MSDVANYALSKVGQKVTVPENPYGGQCIVLIDDIVRRFTGKNMLGVNAINGLFKARQNGFPVTMDGPGRAPKAGDVYIIDTGDEFGHIEIAIADSDGTEIQAVAQNVDGYRDDNHNGINDQLEVGGGGYTRRVGRDWYADGTLYDQATGARIGRVVGWFSIPAAAQLKKGGKMPIPTKNVAGDIFSGLITDVDPNQMNADGNRARVDRIVIHHNAGTSDEGARRTWYTSTGIGTSAHYQVTPGKLWGCVGENMTAYHAGDYGMNQRSIGIEHLNETGAPGWTIAEATYQRSAALIADICQRHGIPIDRGHILKHGEVSPTACPGGIDVDRLVRMAQAIANGAGAAPASAPIDQVLKGQNMTFTIYFAEDIDSRFKKGQVWLCETARGVYYHIRNEEELKYISEAHKGSTGRDLYRFTSSRKAPVHIRLIEGLRLKQI